MQTFINRYGPFAVFLARFTPGLRFMAGPLAGTVRMPVLKFVVSNTIGALLYVPLMVAAGYGVGYGFGQTIERAQRAVGEVEHLVLLTAMVLGLIMLGVRAVRGRAKF